MRLGESAQAAFDPALKRSEGFRGVVEATFEIQKTGRRSA
jgi:hypothetical protein